MRGDMTIREMTAADEAEVLRLMALLWPDFDDDHVVDDAVLVLDRAPDAPGALGGFLALTLRPYAEGCSSSPVPYVEGWWVDADLRGQGWGRRLMDAAAQWARARGATELASDAELGNEASIEAHGCVGFAEVTRIVCFRRPLVP